MEPRIFTDYEYRAFLDWFMVSDPWVESVAKEPIENVLNAEAKRRGYEDWVIAYHKLTRLDG